MIGKSGPLRGYVLHKVLAFIVLNCAFIQAQSNEYVDSGACPFECCKYGKWIANETIRILKTPEMPGVQIGELSDGESFSAITGEVHVKPAMFVFDKPFDKFAAGDTITLLTYFGEGEFKSIESDGTKSIVVLDFSPYNSPKYGRISKLGRLLNNYRIEWWAKIVLDNGENGWIDARQKISGNDGCN